MDGDVLAFAQVMTVIAGFSAFAVVTFFGARWAWHKTKPQPPERPSQIDDTRFERLEQAVDSIAVEIERISEAQRFSAKLMSDRLPAREAERVLPSGSRANS
jgi:hypothetical protein